MRSDERDTLDALAVEARRLGLTYGEYVAKSTREERKAVIERWREEKRKKRKSRRKRRRGGEENVPV